jgi:cobalt transporter subunit CbtA
MISSTLPRMTFAMRQAFLATEKAMLFRTIYSAVVAGILAGVVLFALEHWTTLPLIHQAERYEKTETAAHPASHASDAPQDAFVRAAYTTVGDVLVAVGFGMLLTAMYALSGKFGLLWGILWGLAGFATFHLGPAAVVPPSIPALDLAPLSLRQSAWLIAALSTGLGLAMFTFGPRGAKFAGVLLLFLPILLFRYLFPLSGGETPSQALSTLERLFIMRALGDSLIFWLVLGAISGWMFENSADLQNGLDPTWSEGRLRT